MVSSPLQAPPLAAGKGSAEDKINKTANQAGVTASRVKYAAVVLRHTPDLAASVLAGSISLDNAYEEARIRKGQADSYESRFNALKADAPDLADLVVEGQLKLEEAEAAQREREERSRRRKKLLAEALHALSAHAYAGSSSE